MDLGNDNYQTADTQNSKRSCVIRPYTYLFAPLNAGKVHSFTHYDPFANIIPELNTTTMSSNYNSLNRLSKSNSSASLDIIQLISSTANNSMDSGISINTSSYNESDISDFPNNLSTSKKIYQSTKKIKYDHYYPDNQCASIQILQHTSQINFDAPKPNNFIFRVPLPPKNNERKKISSPRRYPRWKKSKSCFTLPNVQTTSYPTRFCKVNSLPDLFTRHDPGLEECLWQDINVKKNRKIRKVVRRRSRRPSLSNVWDDINFSFTFKRSMKVNPSIKKSLNSEFMEKNKLSCGLFPSPTKSIKLLTPSPLKNPRSDNTTPLCRKEKFAKRRKFEGQPIRMVISFF